MVPLKIKQAIEIVARLSFIEKVSVNESIEIILRFFKLPFIIYVYPFQIIDRTLLDNLLAYKLS